MLARQLIALLPFIMISTSPVAFVRTLQVPQPPANLPKYGTALASWQVSFTAHIPQVTNAGHIPQVTHTGHIPQVTHTGHCPTDK